MDTVGLTETKANKYSKPLLIAFASILIPPIISLVLIIIVQLYFGESDHYACSICECNYLGGECVSRYGQDGAILAGFIMFFEWFIKFCMIFANTFTKKEKEEKSDVRALNLFNLCISVFLAIVTHFYGEIGRFIHLLFYECSCKNII